MIVGANRGATGDVTQAACQARRVVAVADEQNRAGRAGAHERVDVLLKTRHPLRVDRAR